MTKTISSYLWIALLFAVALPTYAAPLLDEAVKGFLASKPLRSNETLSVLLVYKRSASLPALPHESRFHVEIEKAMIQNTELQERLTFKKISKGMVKSPVQALWIINGSLADLNRGQIQTLVSESSLESITFSGKKIKLSRPPESRLVTNATDFTYGLKKLKVPELRAKYSGLLGTGIRVGILDSGIDAEHPDLKGKIKVFKDFSSEKSPVPVDGFQHGTHVAGTIAGGAASGQAIGVAPGAELIIARIFNGNAESETKDILLAMQWIADPDGNPNTNDFPLVINSSWGDDAVYNTRNPEEDPFCRVLDSWVKLGIVPVFSAGNSGPRMGSVGVPGACPQAFTVGSTDGNDRSPWYSSGGPANWKSVSFIKPDVSAPGLDIYSAQPGGGYQLMTGTSMSAPHITGSLALILQADPGLGVEGAENALLAGTVRLREGDGQVGDPGKNNTFGWGRPDLLKSIDLLKKNP